MVDSSSSEAMDKEHISPSINPLFMGGYSITKRGTSIASIVFLLLAQFIIPCYALDYETSSGRNLSGEEGGERYVLETA